MNPYIEGFLLLICVVLAIWGIILLIVGKYVEWKDEREYDEFLELEKREIDEILEQLDDIFDPPVSEA